MLAFLRFEWRRIFCVKKNLISLGFIFLFSTYFVLSGVDEYRQFLNEKKIFLRYEKEKVSHVVNYSQYGGFGFRILFEASPLNLFFINSNILQDVESNIDTFEMIEVESSFKGNKLFLKRGYFKDFAGIPLVFGSLFMLYLGHLALISSAYLRFITRNMSLLKYYIMTTISRFFWMDLFFTALSIGFFYLVRILGHHFFSAGAVQFFSLSPVSDPVSKFFLPAGPADHGPIAISQDILFLVFYRVVRLYLPVAGDQPASAYSTSQRPWNRPRRSTLKNFAP